MIDPSHIWLSIVKQCSLMGVSRSSFYYQGKGESRFNLKLMRLIDEQWLKTPFFGSRRMAKHLRGEGYNASRKRVRRLMRKMGIAAIYPKPRTTRPRKENPVYPYLLRNLAIDRPNQVWCSDITYRAPGSLCWHGDARGDTSMFGIHMDRARKRYGPSGRSLLRKSVSPSGGDPLYTGGVTQPVGKGA